MKIVRQIVRREFKALPELALEQARKKQIQARKNTRDLIHENREDHINAGVCAKISKRFFENHIIKTTR